MARCVEPFNLHDHGGREKPRDPGLAARGAEGVTRCGRAAPRVPLPAMNLQHSRSPEDQHSGRAAPIQRIAAVEQLASVAAAALRVPLLFVALPGPMEERACVMAGSDDIPRWSDADEAALWRSGLVELVSAGPLEMRDLTRNHPVTQLRAFAQLRLGSLIGAPVRSLSDHAYGVICAAYPTPTVWNDDDREMLQQFARLVASELEQQRRMEELEASEERLAFHLNHDALTGLMTRPALLTRLREALERPAPPVAQAGPSSDVELDEPEEDLVALYAVELVGLSRVTARFGRPVADQALMALARRVQRAAGPEAAVARLGEHRLGVLVERVRTPRLADTMAARLREAVCAPLVVAGETVRLEVELGTSLSATTSRLAEHLFNRADTELARESVVGSRPPVEREIETPRGGPRTLPDDVALASSGAAADGGAAVVDVVLDRATAAAPGQSAYVAHVMPAPDAMPATDSTPGTDVTPATHADSGAPVAEELRAAEEVRAGAEEHGEPEAREADQEDPVAHTGEGGATEQPPLPLLTLPSPTLAPPSPPEPPQPDVDRHEDAHRAQATVQAGSAAEAVLAAPPHLVATDHLAPERQLRAHETLAAPSPAGRWRPGRGRWRWLTRRLHAMTSLLRNASEFATLDSGEMKLRFLDVPMEKMLEDLRREFLQRTYADALHFHVHPCAAGVRVRADRRAVRRVLRHLLENALKFTPPGGEVTVVCEANAQVVNLTVRDTGCGIPATWVTQVVEPYVQIDAHLRPRGLRGLGLGLAISQRLATAMGGALYVESLPERGSSFTLTLLRG